MYKRKAIDILYEKMMFYNDKAYIIANGLIKVIQEGEKARGDLLVSLSKDLHRFNDIVIDCATKLAPYQAPKLGALEVRNNTTVRFVVAAPPLEANTNKWLDKVVKEQKLLIKPDAIDAEVVE